MSSPQVVSRGTVYGSAGSWPVFVRVLRTRARLSQAAVTALIGVGANTVSRWERGESKPTRPEDFRAVERLCAQLHGDLGEAYRALGYAPPEPEIADPLLRQLAALLKHPKASAEAKARIRRIVERELAAELRILDEEPSVPRQRKTA